MRQGSGTAGSKETGSSPTLLVNLEPWHKVFLDNLADLLWLGRRPGDVLSSQPGAFWPDVFVRSGLPWRRFLESAVYHSAVIAALWGLARLWPQPLQVIARPAFSRTDVIYNSAAEYLPPLNTGDLHLQAPQTGEPEYAAQAIISVPREPDNRTQTIVTPPDIRLDREVLLPNMVAWTRAALVVPVAATSRAAAQLKLPSLPEAVVAPALDPVRTALLQAPTLPQPAIVEPPPAVEAATIRRPGDINVGRAEVVAPAPDLPLSEQRALAAVGRVLSGNAAAAVPPPPAIQGVPSDGGGRLIALGIHPVAARGPVEAPAGNRRGSFAATPQGKPGSPGTPDIQAAGHKPGSGLNGGGSDPSNSIPSGLLVGAVPVPGEGTTAASGQGNGAGGSTSKPDPSDKPRLLADATPPRMTSLPGNRASQVPESKATELDKKIFGDRKFYSMTLNMPNLNSAGGSWVIRFAEMNETRDHGELTAPVATQKVDPAYPLELMRHNVQGTVTLYAVIRGDGSVGDVRVLRSVDDRLDEYARQALSRWRFRPATKNGSTVDLEAVVAIPFRPVRNRLGF